MKPPAFGRDANAAALWAGVTTFVWFASGMVPLQIAVSSELSLDPAQASSSLFIVWLSAAVSTIILSISYRQPIPITWTIPGLIYLGTLAGQFTFAELVGANLVAGILIVAFGLLGIGGKIMDWIPLPVVMGMFAGSILSYVTRMVRATLEEVTIAGSTAAGYLLGKLIGRPQVPPMGLAIVFGGAGVLLTEEIAAGSVSWTLPALAFPEMNFSFSAFIAVSLPMLVLSMVLGNVQGLGFLLVQGYRVPVKSVTVLVGLSSILNAALGGYPAIVGRTAVAILAAPDAGPVSGRYVGSLFAAVLTVSLAVAASPVTSFIAILPRSYVLVLAGLAILSSLQEAFERAFNSRLRFGALIAFIVAATPFTIAGVTSAFWAIVAGILASLVAESRELLAHWQEKKTVIE